MAVLSVGVVAQPVVLPSPVGNNSRAIKIEPAEKVDNAVAIVLDAQGDCTVSNDGQNFRPLKKTAELGQGVTIRTAGSGSADVFLKRMGSTIRIKPNSEVFLNRTIAKKDQQSELNTAVEVRKGKMLAVLHKNVPGSSLDIKNAAGKTLTDKVAGSQYMISADKIEKVSSSDRLDEKTMTAVRDHMDLDEVRALSETFKGSENPGLQP